MQKRVFIYSRLPLQQTRTKAEVLDALQRAVEDRGYVVVATFVDDAAITRRGKYAGWREMLLRLDQVDQVVVADAGDLPGRNVADLLKLLGAFRDHRIGLYLHREGIDTSSSSFATLEIVEVCRRAKLSAAIRAGQAKALAAGKRIGRPPIPPGVLRRIRACLLAGDGTRSIARRFNISPASVSAIRGRMSEVDAEAASPIRSSMNGAIATRG
jgi:DNA invertase Pin-like site-specific DNA recombinase